MRVMTRRFDVKELCPISVVFGISTKKRNEKDREKQYTNE